MYIPPCSAGTEPMSATLPIRPGYPSLEKLESLFSEGPVSFAKLSAEASRRTDKKPHTFDFGVISDEPDFWTEASRHRLAGYLQSNPGEVQKLMEREFARSREKAAKKSDRRKSSKPSVKKLVAEMKLAKAAASSSDGGIAEQKTDARHTKLGSSGIDSTNTTAAQSDAAPTKPTKSRKTARDKFRRCENCEEEIVDRIQLCAGCKKVAYCNIRCQKAHWKQHKKSCLYVQKPQPEKIHRCESCDKELSERVLVCAGCKLVAYCNAICQRSHWKQHKKTCSYVQKKSSDET